MPYKFFSEFEKATLNFSFNSSLLVEVIVETLLISPFMLINSKFELALPILEG